MIPVTLSQPAPPEEPLPVGDGEFETLCRRADILRLRGTPVALALSGGPDSVALGCLLSRAGFAPLHALVVDHGLRPDSADEARRAQDTAAGWPGVRTAVLTRTPPPGAARLMETARRDRYRLLAGYCRDHEIRTLFVAHHRDDQAETFLFRLAKGSGLDGLAAMSAIQPYGPGLDIVRPLLDVPKERLAATCRAHGLSFAEDPSNADPRFARPRLRAAREALEAEGLSVKRLAVTAARLSRARQALDQYARAALETAQTGPEKKGRIALQIAPLAAHPPETRLRVLALALDGLTPENEAGYGPRREKLEALAERLFSGTPFRGETLGGFIFRIDEKTGQIDITREKTPPAAADDDKSGKDDGDGENHIPL